MKQNNNIIPAVAVCLCIYIGYTSISLAITRSTLYLLPLLLIPIVILIFRNIYEQINKEKLIKLFHEQWKERDDKKRNFQHIPTLFKVLLEKGTKEFYLDDQTWNDLDMNEIYSRIDATKSTPGEHGLYRILRTPLLDENRLEKRKAVIKYFQEHKDKSVEIEYYLHMLGIQKINSIASFLWNDITIKTTLKPFLHLMFLFSLASVASIFLTTLSKATLFVLLVLLINVTLHLIVASKIGGEIKAITYLAKIIKTSKKILNTLKDVEDPAVKEYVDILNDTYKNASRITRKIPNFGGTESFDMSFDLFNVFFLIEEQTFFAVINDIKLLQDELRKMYICVGEIDAFVSTARFRDNIGTYSVPEFSFKKQLIIRDAVHPLLDSAVSNSITLKDGGAIITGSNMSGKSTFLRTLGVNAIMAQSIVTTAASFYYGCLFKILTSISPSDNLFHGKSYYFGEAEALQRIVKVSEENVYSICIIDEIFRGTNPVERVAAAIEILNYLAEHNSLVIAATHDREITGEVAKHYDCYFFEEDVTKEGLTFDYKIKKGVSTTTNAIKVLGILGYPDVIIENANKRIKKDAAQKI